MQLQNNERMTLPDLYLLYRRPFVLLEFFDKRLQRMEKSPFSFIDENKKLSNIKENTEKKLSLTNRIMILDIGIQNSVPSTKVMYYEVETTEQDT